MKTLILITVVLIALIGFLQWASLKRVQSATDNALEQAEKYNRKHGKPIILEDFTTADGKRNIYLYPVVVDGIAYYIVQVDVHDQWHNSYQFSMCPFGTVPANTKDIAP